MIPVFGKLIIQPIQKTPEKIRNEFQEIISKAGESNAKEKCWEIVVGQKYGRDVLVAAKVFSETYPSSRDDLTIFEFADKTDVTLSSSQLEALKKDSNMIKDLFEESDGSRITLTHITKTEFLSILNSLYPDESFEKAAYDPLKIIKAANYLDIKELSAEILGRFNHQIQFYSEEKHLADAVDLYKSFKNLPKDLREPLELKMATYFGKMLSNATQEKRTELIKQYNEIQITSLSFKNEKNAKQILVQISQIVSLKNLDLSNTDIADKDIELIPKQITSLNMQCCNEITDKGLGKLPLGLKNLNLWGCNQIKDDGIGAIPRGLLSLNIGLCKKITDIGLGMLPPSLTSLNLNECNKITDTGIGILPISLQNLVLSFCTKITDKGLQNLRFPLTSLNLWGCKEITDIGLGILPPSLTSLNLKACYKITDNGLGTLPPSLSDLDIGACIEITDKGLAALPSRIKRLNVYNCNKVTSAAVNLLRQRGMEITI